MVDLQILPKTFIVNNSNRISISFHSPPTPHVSWNNFQSLAVPGAVSPNIYLNLASDYDFFKTSILCFLNILLLLMVVPLFLTKQYRSPLSIFS